MVWPAFLAVSLHHGSQIFFSAQFGMQLSCFRSVFCVSRRLLGDVSSPPFVQLYSEIQYVRMCIINYLL